jgi:hypothetical protein
LRAPSAVASFGITRRPASAPFGVWRRSGFRAVRHLALFRPFRAAIVSELAARAT